MPIYDLDETVEIDYEAKAEQSQATVGRDSRQFAETYLSGGIRTPGAAIALTAAGSVIDLIDTAASSVLPGVQREDVNETLLGAVGSPGLTGWYNENKGAIEVGSGIAGIIASDFVAKRFLEPAGAAMRMAKQIPYVKQIASLDKQYNNAVRVATLTNRELARRGATGVERFIGEEINLAAISTSALRVTAGSAARNVRAAQIGRGLVRNLTTEGVMAATLHTNSFLYDDDLSHNIAWGAAGLGIGAQIDNMVASYTLRKMANSSAVRRLNAGAYDPSGKENQRLVAGNIANAIAKAAEGGVGEVGYLFGGGGAVTDRITSMMIQSQELVKKRGVTERARSLFGKREAIATPIEKMAFEDLNKVTVRGLRGVSRAGFGTKLEGLGAPLKESLAREPGFLFGIEEIGTTVENLTRRETIELRNTAIKGRLEVAQELLANGGKWERRNIKGKDGKTVFMDNLIPLSDEARVELQLEVKELQFAEKHVPVTMLEPGEWSPISMGEVAEGFTPARIMQEKIGTGEDGITLWTRERTKDTDSLLGIRNDGELFLPAGAKIDRLDVKDMLHLYHVGNKVVRDLAEGGGKFIVPENPNWFQLDLAEQLMKATDNTASVQWPKGMSRQSAMVESFAQKVDGLRVRQRALKMGQALDETQAFKNKIYFNMPRLTSYQQGLMGTSEHPFEMLYSAFKNGDEVRNTPYTEILKGMNDSKKITGLTDDTVDTLDGLQGNSFNFLLDRDGNGIKPVVGFKRPMQPAEWSQSELFVRQATNAMYVRDKLLGESSDEITRGIVQILTADPSFITAGRVTELADDQSRSMVPGFGSSAPQTSEGSFMNAITSRERRDADNFTMLAASKLKELQTRVTGGLMRKLITETMADNISLVNSPRNITTKLALNQFYSFRPGWELAREPVEQSLPKGKGYGFMLDHTSELNKARFREAYGRDLTKGQLMLNPDGKTVVLDELAMDTVSRMQTLHDATLKMKNTLLRSQGLKELKPVPWYVPPPNTQNKYIAYTFDNQDNIVPGMTVVADSPEQLTKMKAEIQDSKQWRTGYTLRQRNEVESFMDLWDKAQMDYVSPNTTAIQSNKKNFGRTGGNVIDTAAFDEALISTRDGMVSHGDDIMETLFKEQIKSAKARAAISKVEQAAGSRNADQHSSQFDRYIQNLTGRSSIGAKDSFLGEFYSWAERRLNGMLNSGVVRGPADTYQSLKDYISTARPGKDRLSVERFKKLSQELGNYMPYKSAMEMVERETNSRTPSEVANITSKLSWFEAASRLRWLESFHAVANIGGILSNTSSVIRALQPMAGETIEDAARRNSSLSMMMATPNGNKMILPHTNKLLYNAMKDAWGGLRGKNLDEFTQKAIKLGYMDQEVAEFNRQWGAIDSKEGWRAFVFGNENADPNKARTVFGKTIPQGVSSGLGKFEKSGGLDKWLSVVSDKSEEFTRQWGMYAGRRVAESMGIESVDDQLSFAHDLTNKLIANYDPRNRPEVFQGALGAPLGLFQSYVMNYYQRMFRYLETGNSRALATQFATQSAVFGVSSLPGWDALNWAFFDRQQGENEDPVDSLYKRFGQFDGDLIMHGTLSNLPKLFGGDGISLYTRGDSAVRMPVVNLPMADTISRVWNGIGQAVDTLGATGKIGANHLAEIASNVMTNRPLAGMLEVFGANGYDTSFDQQVVSEAQGFMESTWRVLGVRAMQQQKETELFYQNRNAQEEQGARKDVLRSATRAAVRDQRYDELPGLYSKYVEQGGDPRYYSRWVKESFKSALDTRGERMLEKALKDKDNSKNVYIGRLLDAQVGVDEDEQNTDDYGREAEMNRVIEQGWESQPLMPDGLDEPFADPEGLP